MLFKKLIDLVKELALKYNLCVLDFLSRSLDISEVDYKVRFFFLFYNSACGRLHTAEISAVYV